MPESSQSTRIKAKRDLSASSAETSGAGILSRRTNRYVLLVVLLVGLSFLSAPLQASNCAPGQNLTDTDSNGLFDHACVGDWNNNGTCEMEEDLRAAILSLNDPGPKTVLVDECSFVPPAATQGLYGILELPDNTTLLGFGDASLLNGFVETDVTSQQAVITNSDHFFGNSNIHISNLRIDGGWRGGDASDFGHARIGIRFTNCADCSATDVEVVDTLHACLYASNSTQIEFKDSLLERCGNYTGEGLHFPCVYLYAFNGGLTDDVLVEGNQCNGSGSSAMSTRRGSTNSHVNNLVFRNNIVRNTAFYPTGAHRRCFRLSGVDGAQYLNNTCINTGGLASNLTESYYSDGLDVNASANITVDGLNLFGAKISPPLHVRKHAENFTLRNVTVNGVQDGHCLEIETPVRNFSLDGADLTLCGKVALNQNNSDPSGAAADETLTIRNVEITSAGTDEPSDGMRFHAPAKGLVLDGVTVNGATANGVSFLGALEDSTISNLTISDVAGHGMHLNGDTQNVSLAFNDVSNAGQDCILLEGSPAPALSHQQTSITKSGLVNCAGRGIATAAGMLAVRDFEINDNNIDGVDGDGIELLLAGSQSENVELQSNSLRNFGRDMAGGPHYGIELSGALPGTLVFENILNDWNDQATYGIYHDVPGSHPTYLCSNPCVGTLRPTECVHEVGNPAYETDSDLDGTVDACEDDDADGVYGSDDNCPDVSNPMQTDADLDGVGDPCDNCADEYNPGQSDFDADFEGDLCDVDDGLIYVRFPGAGTLNWQIEHGFSKWNAYRGNLAVLLAGGDYTQNPFVTPLAGRVCSTSSPPWSDTVLLAPGKVVFYLVSGVQGTTEGSLGNNSSGQPRFNAFPCAGDLFTGF